MDDETFTLAVETTAQIEVLRAATVTLVAQLLTLRPVAEQDDLLDDFVARLSSRHPAALLRTPRAQRLHDEAAGKVPTHAVLFAADVRQAMACARLAVPVGR